MPTRQESPQHDLVNLLRAPSRLPTAGRDCVERLAALIHALTETGGSCVGSDHHTECCLQVGSLRLVSAHDGYEFTVGVEQDNHVVLTYGVY